MIEAAGLGLPRLGERGEQLFGAKQQVVEIHGAGGLQSVLVAAIGRGGQMLLVGLSQGGRLFRPNRGRFPAADEVEQIAGPKQPVGHLDLAQGRAGDPFLIAPVVDGKAGGIAELADVAAQDADAERMERGDFRPLLELFAQQGGGPFLHFVGRLVGEGDRQDAFGPDAVADQLGDAVGDHPRLAGSRPRQHQQWPRERVDGVVLGGIQVHAARETDNRQWAAAFDPRRGRREGKGRAEMTG